MYKTAFIPQHGQNNQSPVDKGTFVATALKHPASFTGHVLKGEAAGLAGGAIGGALVAGPFAAALALKKGQGGTYLSRLGQHLYKAGIGETVGGGVLGMGLGANQFYKKYYHDNKKPIAVSK